MNKKLLLLLVGFLMAIMITACSEDENANAPNEPDTTETEQNNQPDPEPEPEPDPAPAQPSRPEPSTDPKNIALASNGTTVEVDSNFSGYSKEPLNDGYRLESFLSPHEVAWASSLEGDNHWVEFTFPETKTPHILNITWAEQKLPSQELHIQVLQDGDWVTVQTWSTEETQMEMATIEIANPVPTEKLRIFQDKDKGPVGYSNPNIMWIGEVEIYEPEGPLQPAASTDPLNIALASNGTTVEVDSLFNQYSKDPINDGYRVEDFLGPHEVAWASSLEGDNHWVEFTFPEPKTPERVDIYWGENHASQEIHIQVLQDGDWATVHTWTNDEGNMLMTSMEIEEPVETTALRIFQDKDKGPAAYRDPNILWISEVEIYEPNRSAPRTDIKNIALASNGTTVEVDSTHGSYTVEPINDGLRLEEYLNWNEVAWASALEGDHHWVEFTFPEPKTPRIVDIYWSERNIPSQEIQIQVPDNGDWKTIQTWSTDELEMIMVSIEIENPVETDKLRLFQDKDKGPIDYSNPNIMWMSEVEIYE